MTKQGSQRKLTRRSFLKTTALAAGAMASAGVVGCSSVDTSGDAAQNAPVEEKSYISTCRSNCGGNCALSAKVREGKIVSAFPVELPERYEGIEDGCARGMTNPLRIYGTHRLTHPMKRVGEKGSGEWEQITWDEAIQTVADKMTAAIEEYGPSSVCIQHGAGNMRNCLDSQAITIGNCFGWTPSHNGIGMSRFIQKVGATALGIAGDQAGMYFNFFVTSAASGSVEDLVNSKTIFFWGGNPADASFTRSSWYWACKAKEQGATIVTIDPLFTATAAQSDEWVPVRMGTDNALMCAMSNYIIENGLANEAYLKSSSVAPLLIKEGGAYLRLSDVGLAEAGSEGDVPAVWDEAAQAFVAHNEAVDPALHGTFDAEGVSVRTVYDATLEVIAPFTVEFAARECGIPAEQIERIARLAATEGPTSYQIGWGIEHTSESWRFTFSSKFLASLTGSVGIPGGGYFQASAASSIYRTPARMETSFVALEDAKPVTVITGDYLVEITETGKWAGQDFPVRVVYVHACDPLDNFSGVNALIEAYKKIDFVVTAELFMTTTAHWSDMVLPAAGPWEAEDFFCSGGAMMCQKGIEPVGEARPDFDIIRDIAVAMGYTDLFPLDREGYLRALLDTEENIAAGTAYDDYHEKGVIIGEYVAASNPAVEYNALGRTQFYMEGFLPRDNWGQTVEYADRFPNYKPSVEAYPDNPKRADYPLFGFSSHNVYHGQSSWAHNAWLDNFRTLNGKPFCIISEEAAAERGIKSGDKVRATSQHGTCVLNAAVSPGIQRESVWFPHGFYWDEFEEGSAGQLTGHNIDPISGNANFNDFILQIEKA